MMVRGTALTDQMNRPLVNHAFADWDSFSAMMETVLVHIFSVTASRTVTMALMRILFCVVRCVISLILYRLLFAETIANKGLAIIAGFFLFFQQFYSTLF